MSEEKRMISSYEVTQSIHIGRKEVVFGVDEKEEYPFHILDRVGGGDAFVSGLIYAMLHNYNEVDMINFAVASSAIKHTIHGDGNITDDAQMIWNLMNMNYDIRR